MFEKNSAKTQFKTSDMASDAIAYEYTHYNKHKSMRIYHTCNYVMFLEIYNLEAFNCLPEKLDYVYAIYKAKKLKIVKLKCFKPNVFGCLPSSGLMMMAMMHLMMANSRKRLV